MYTDEIFFYVHHVTIFKERMHSARLFFTLNCNIQGRSVSLYHLSMTSPGKPPVIGLNLHARGIRSDRRTRNRRRISFENRPSRAPGLSRTMASPRLNLAVQRVSPPLARDMRRRNPWQEVAGSSCPPGGAWITGEVDASCRGRVEGDSCQVAQLYGVCRWYVRRGPHVWNLVRVVHVRLSRHGHDTNVPLAMARTLTLSLDRKDRTKDRWKPSRMSTVPDGTDKKTWLSTVNYVILQGLRRMRVACLT